MAWNGLFNLGVKQRLDKFGERIRIGFVPLVDCAPIALAQEAGIFAKYNLDVELCREPGWATIRDKMAFGDLDAAHALVGLGFALTWGLGVVKTPVLTGFLLNSNGDAITISKKLYDYGITDPASLAEAVHSMRGEGTITLAVPHSVSTHHLLLLRWLRPAGVKPGCGVRIIVLPPPMMPTCLAAGTIDGYCVGEPYNTIAVRNDTGVILAESAQLFPLHPEKALLVLESFHERSPERHFDLIRAIREAAALCETPDGREEVAAILARDAYLGLEPSLIRSSLFPQEPATKSFASESFHVFHHPEVNPPSLEKANWVLQEMRLAGLLDETGTNERSPVRSIFREDIYTDAFAEPSRSKEKIAAP